MTKKKWPPRSLNYKVLYISVIGLIVGLSVYFLGSFAGRSLIDRFYMSNEQITSRKAAIHAEFADYVRSNAISGNDTSALARWTESHESATIIMYGKEQIHFSHGEAVQSEPAERNTYEFGRLYLVSFRDGLYQIAIVDSSQNVKYRLVEVITISLGCAAYIFICLLYAKRLTGRIIALSKEAAQVSGGDLERKISAKGDDEITALAASMDNMRRSVIERIGNESRAWQANAQLITAISHDIRTPMTSMIGYLGLLSESDFEDKERCHQFADSAYNKAMDLKYLTDELFRYFLVFGKAELKTKMESIDGRLLWEQLIGEAAFDLEDAGFKVKQMDFKGECLIHADPMYLMRVMNNLVSNVKKYADAERFVIIMSELKDNCLSLCVSNSIPPRMDRIESTKIGLMTCGKIMESMGGSFETRSDAGHFAAELTIPAKLISEE